MRTPDGRWVVPLRERGRGTPTWSRWFCYQGYDRPSRRRQRIRARSFEVDFNVKRESPSQTYKLERDRFNLKRSRSSRGAPFACPVTAVASVAVASNDTARVYTSGLRASRGAGAGTFEIGMFIDGHFHPPHRRAAGGVFLANR
jgi:hypothetical protein